MDPGTGLDLAAPLKFNHAANLPFSDRGTGISFQPATAFAHSSNEPVQPLGTGITLDSALANDHAIDAVVRDAAGYDRGLSGDAGAQPVVRRSGLSPSAGSMVLRDAAGLVVDSLNYGDLVDPWAAEGYQAASGAQVAHFAPPPSAGRGFGRFGSTAGTPSRSAGRFPDGADTEITTTIFMCRPAPPWRPLRLRGADNIKVTSVADFAARARRL